MSNLAEHYVAQLVPEIYTNSIVEFRYPGGTDMSRSNKCHTLTLDLMRALHKIDIPARRELHKDPFSGVWHYVIAHGTIEAEPTNEDVITDLNPWLFPNDGRSSGYLHAPRTEVMARLKTAGMSAQDVALRALETIVLPHSTNLLSFHTHPPLPIP